jgi:hypothetical protein
MKKPGAVGPAGLVGKYKDYFTEPAVMPLMI